MSLESTFSARSAVVWMVMGSMSGMACGFISPVSAQQLDELETPIDPTEAIASAEAAVMEEITVSVTRVAKPLNAIPNAVRLIDDEAMKQQMLFSSNFLDGLGTIVPSFSPTRQKLTTFGETFRGRKPLFLIDGVPQSTPLRDGSRESFTIDAAAIERVEVIYGANAIQGVGATGGIINYVTKSAPSDGRLRTDVEAAITADGGFNGDGYGQRLSGFMGQDFGRFDIAAGAAVESRGVFYDAQGRRVGVDSAQGDIMDSDSWNIFLKAGYDLTDSSRVQVMANAFELQGDGEYVAVFGNRTTGLPTTSRLGVTPGLPPINKVRTLSLDYTDDDLFGGTLRAQAFVQDFESVFGGSITATFQDAALAPVGTLFDQSSNNSDKLGAKLSYAQPDVAGLGLEVVSGVDVLRDETFQSLLQSGRFWVPQTVFRNAAPFIQAEQKFFGEMLRISAGARHEIAELKVDDFRTLAFYGGGPLVRGGSPNFSDTLLNAGAVLNPTDEITAYASYSEGFTMPDVGRILREIRVPNQSVETYLNLVPVLADNLEVGATYATERINVTASYFWSNSDFGQRLVPGLDGVFRVAREKTKIDGFEGAVKVQATEDVSFGVNYAALNGRFDSNADGQVDTDLGGVNISPDRLNIFTDVSFGENWSSRLQLAKLFDRTFQGGDPRLNFNGYTTVDASLGWMSESVGRIDLGVQNLLDEGYITYYSQTNGPTDNLRYFAGRGRTYTLRYAQSF